MRSVRAPRALARPAASRRPFPPPLPQAPHRALPSQSMFQSLTAALSVALAFAVVVVADDEAAPTYVSQAPKGSSVVFFANFDDEDVFDEKWTMSQDKEYQGEFGLRPGEKAVEEDDLALEIMSEARKHGIAAKFNYPVALGDKPLVVQYEVRLEKPHTCGGLYVKLLQEDETRDLSTLNGDSEYAIMFGPDKCGGTNKVHFILKHENPVTGEVEEKHATSPPAVSAGSQTHLYTLVINPDNTYEYYIDNEKSGETGNLLSTMDPPVNPPKEIDDPEDFKPEDWVDEAKIDDPESSKPDDWDEDAPAEIIDEAATMPEDWDEDATYIIADPSAAMPEDWDEEEDGEWEAPKVCLCPVLKRHILFWIDA
eukprot:SAG31_NODE_318_length_17799_cov_79.857571_14_plen_368_part_00